MFTVESLTARTLTPTLSRKLGRTVNVLRVERVTAESGQISYLVTEQ